MNLYHYQHPHKALGWRLLPVMLVFQAGHVLAEVSDALSDVVPRVRIVKPINDADQVTLGGNRPPLLDICVDKGGVDGNLLLKNMMLVLKSSPEQQTRLDAFSTAQQTAGSPDYHHWLTPEEFASHFGIADQDMQIIKNYLTSKGFSINQIASGGRGIMFSGKAIQVKNAFHTEIHHYVCQGEKHIANESDPQIPAALSQVIGGIINLNDFHSHAMSGKL
jgi:hypothetical protein